MRRCAGALVAAMMVAAPGCGGGAEPFSLAAVVDNAKGESSRGTMKMKVQGKESFEMDGTYVGSGDGQEIEFEGELTTAGETLRDVVIRGRETDVWVTAREFRGTLPGGKRWIHSSNPSGSLESMSPSDFVEFMRDAKGVKKVGTEDVAGKPATRYSGNVSLKSLAEETGGDAAAAFRSLGIGDKQIPLDVWVSEEDMPARIRIEIAHAGEKVLVDATMEEYGVEVDVEPPPKRQVIEEKDLD